MGITVEHLTKRFGDFVAVNDVSLHVATGQLAAMLGPSGGGKSTILRMIAGLEPADSGTVQLEGERVDHLHTRDRQVGFVFQHYALFRHMTVEKNIGFGLQVRKVPVDEMRERVNSMIALMGLRGMEKRYPDQLSGGQRQRVALARALAPRPRLLLLDEPFGAVDAKVREELGRWLRGLHDELDVTSIFVTHDQEEAFSLADQVIVIARGEVEQHGRPVDILDNPATEFMARFVGDANVFESVVNAGHAMVGAVRVPVKGVADNTRVRLVIRSYDLKFFKQDGGPALVNRMLYLGDRVKVDATIEGVGPIFAQFPRRSSLLVGIEPGSRIGIEVTLARAFPAS